MQIDLASAVWLSLKVATVSVIVGAPVAVGLGWLLARRDFPGKWLLSTALMVPMVIPPVVTGLLLLELFGTGGVLFGVADAVGLQVAFAPAGAVLAAFAVGLPFFVLSVRSALEAIDVRLEEVAWSLGAAPAEVARRITLPLALPGFAAGAVLAFARALGEFGATAVIAGNIEGSTRTIALAVYTLLESPHGDSDAQLLAGISIGMSLVALTGYELLSRWHRRRLEVHGD